MLLTIARDLYGKLRQAWPPNRVVTLLGPLVFVPAAGWLAVKAAEWGLPNVDPGFLVGVFAAGALAAIESLRKFMDGWIQYEAQLADPDKDPVLAKVHQKPPPEVKESGEIVGGGDQVPSGDGDYELSQPDDIAESDIDDPDEVERREREELEGPQ